MTALTPTLPGLLGVEGCLGVGSPSFAGFLKVSIDMKWNLASFLAPLTKPQQAPGPAEFSDWGEPGTSYQEVRV